ncbi:hypothetical protein HK097_005478 [Rhizophlyctis rosea]|uniref:Uncharacterized protein n=1 Tax=Rhizophlyctis rosea TaxID=64517 RepID=A0AAD5SFG9_9FUNG|nr:hypothetical protein HK097_005478 [Rhizophlyctis rosea]
MLILQRDVAWLINKHSRFWKAGDMGLANLDIKESGLTIKLKIHTTPQGKGYSLIAEVIDVPVTHVDVQFQDAEQDQAHRLRMLFSSRKLRGLVEEGVEKGLKELIGRLDGRVPMDECGRVVEGLLAELMTLGFVKILDVLSNKFQRFMVTHLATLEFEIKNILKSKPDNQTETLITNFTAHTATTLQLIINLFIDDGLRQSFQVLLEDLITILTHLINNNDKAWLEAAIWRIHREIQMLYSQNHS